MRADDTFNIISKISVGMNNFLMEEMKKAGVNGLVSSHGSILIHLFNGTLTMNDIAEKIDKTPQTVTTLVKKLVSMGYVKTEKSKKDKRTTIVSLTEKGRELQQFITSASEKLFDTQYLGLSEDEIIEFRRLLLKVLNNFT